MAHRALRGPRWLAVIFALLAAQRIATAAFTPVVEHGPSGNRINAFFLGDGYTASDLAAGSYAAQVQSYVNYMFANSVNSDPFYRYRNFFNVYRVDVVSNQSGADEPQNGVMKDTALDATYRYDGVTDRLLYINDAKADAILNSAIAGSGKTPQMRFCVVNDGVYGGAGGKYSTFAGLNSSAREIALHELSHSFSNLADEYGGNAGSYPGAEPIQVNLTKDSSGAKWSRWLGYNDPTGSVIGAYEGGGFYDRGVYRPTANSKMRTLGSPFNAIGREKLILDIYGKVDPLDSFTANTATLVNPASLSVTRIDDAVINTQWFVDNALQTSFNGQSIISLAGIGLSTGQHSVKVRAYDPTAFDPINGWVRMNTNQLEEFITWDVLVSVVRGDFSHDGHVTAADIPTMLTALADLNAYKSTSGISDSDMLSLGDLNSDGTLTNADAQALLDLLRSGGGPLAAVPEPTSFVLAGIACGAVYRLRRLRPRTLTTCVHMRFASRRVRSATNSYSHNVQDCDRFAPVVSS